MNDERERAFVFTSAPAKLGISAVFIFLLLLCGDFALIVALAFCFILSHPKFVTLTADKNIVNNRRMRELERHRNNTHRETNS